MSLNTTITVGKPSQINCSQGLGQPQNQNEHISTVFRQFIQAELAFLKAKQKKEDCSIDCYIYGTSSPFLSYSKLQKAKEDLAIIKTDYSKIKRTYIDAEKKLANLLKDISDSSFNLPNEILLPIFDCIHTFKDFKSFASTCKFLYAFSHSIPLDKIATYLARDITPGSLTIKSYENQVNKLKSLYQTTFMEIEPFVRQAFKQVHKEDFAVHEQIYETIEQYETELHELQGAYFGTGTYAKALKRVRIIEKELNKAEKMRNELMSYILTPNSDKSDPSYLLKKKCLATLENEYESAKKSCDTLYERMMFLTREIKNREISQQGF